MFRNKKTFFKTKTYNISHLSHNKELDCGQNINMTKQSNKNNNPVKIHVMPPQISDSDITALFNGIVNVVKKKIELEKNAEIINLNINIEKILKELKEKKAEIVRLKNEILFLKSQLQ